MASASELTPTEYINHHLSFFGKQVGDGGFWTLHMDSLSVAILLGFLGLGLIWWVAKGATSGVPTKRQAFVELLFDFIDTQAKGIFKHERHSFVAPTALTVFVWVLLMNAMDFLPVDWMAAFYEHVLGVEHFRSVPTADVNTTFALALAIWFLMIFFNIKDYIFHIPHSDEDRVANYRNKDMLETSTRNMDVPGEFILSSYRTLDMKGNLKTVERI